LDSASRHSRQPVAEEIPASVGALVAGNARRTPAAIVMLAPERAAMSYAGLSKLMDEIRVNLRSSGIGLEDRVAVVVSNGPELAACILAVAASAVCVPLNPSLRVDEFALYFSESHLKAVIVELGINSPAAVVAKSQDLPLFDLLPCVNEEAGVFRLDINARFPGVQCRETGPDDVAILLLTSGTGAKPKVVPITHANLMHSAQNVKASLRLTDKDRCLNVMPIFHSHGIITGTLASVAAGGSVIYPPGFYAPRFFSWMQELSPTWYTAVPTMHLSILARAGQNQKIIQQHPLRFIRSGSSALAPQVMQELESTFHAPVIEAYATTETSQICSNPLPPEARKAGSVGVATGNHVAIMAEDGTLLPDGQIGDIVVRGPSVMSGYEGNAAANHDTFANGWFKTGDRGHLDSEGYLFIAGTTKEVINRGGEKISPRQIDEVLLGHPAVREAITFAFPEPTLGEDVGAAVVLVDEATVTESELCEFVAGKLADFKVPRRIMFVKEIPKGATGKPQRNGMASRLGLTAPASTPEPSVYAAPRDLTEAQVCAIWCEVLDVNRIGIHDNFFIIGGDSLLATSVLSRVSKFFEAELSLRAVFEHPTPAEMAMVIREESRTTERGWLAKFRRKK
jgi:oxalate---CoA ligase